MSNNVKPSPTVKLYLPTLKSNIKNDPIFYNVKTFFIF